MQFERMLIEKESPEERGYGNIKYNLTESSVNDVILKDLNLNLNNCLLCYGDHKGKLELRNLIALEYPGLNADNILLAAGACMALFVVNATLLNPGDHIIVLKPNYATNLEVPKSLGVHVDTLNLEFDNQFQLNLAELEKLFTPKTKVVSITYPNNPTGAMISEPTLKSIIRITKEHGCQLLVDETYRELTYGQKLPTAASIDPSVISVESVSKAFGIPGVRIGWIASKDTELKERFLATKEQICICNSVIDEEITYAMLLKKKKFLNEITNQNKKKFWMLSEWMAVQKHLEWVKPEGGLVCFPRIKADSQVNILKFYSILNEKYGTFVGPGHWFYFDDHYFRIGYGWPTELQLSEGLKCITLALNEAKNST